MFWWIRRRTIWERAFCIYCIISALLTVVLLVTALSHAGATRMTD
jgi:uncharacterized membrane protein